MSKIISLLFCICFTALIAKSNGKGDTVKVDGKVYEKHIMVENVDRPYQLSYFKQQDEKLFFSHNIGSEDTDHFNVSYISEDSKIYHNVNVENGFATAVDEHNKVVYIGSEKGIYRLHPNNMTLDHIVKNYNIWDIFHKKNELYFITYPHQRLYKVHLHTTHAKPEKVEHIRNRVLLYAIDHHDNQYFTNKTGLYEIANGSHSQVLCEGEKTFRCAALNDKGEIHFCGKHGIFVLENKHKLKEILHVRNIFGLTFNKKGHVVYSNANEIVTLEPVK